MSNPNGNPGNKGGGRKGYEWEKKEFKRLTKLLRDTLVITERIRKGKATSDEIERYKLLERAFLKIMDKMFANKQDVKLDFDKPFMILK